MQLQIDTNRLKEMAEAMKEMADKYSITLDNSNWSMDLPSSEQLLLGDYLHAYRVEKSGLTEEEYNSCLSTSGKYHSIEEFYNREIEIIKREMRAGIVRENIPYDINLTKEQAYEKYCSCDRETAKKAADLIDKVNDEAMYHEKELRESYTGDLFTQLGRESDKARYEEKARRGQEKFNVAASNLMGKLEGLKIKGDAAKNYGDFVEKAATDYGENASHRL